MTRFDKIILAICFVSSIAYAVFHAFTGKSYTSDLVVAGFIACFYTIIYLLAKVVELFNLLNESYDAQSDLLDRELYWIKKAKDGTAQERVQCSYSWPKWPPLKKVWTVLKMDIDGRTRGARTFTDKNKAEAYATEHSVAGTYNVMENLLDE